MDIIIKITNLCARRANKDSGSVSSCTHWKDALSHYHRGFLVGRINAYDMSNDKALLVSHKGVSDTAELDTGVKTYVNKNNQFGNFQNQSCGRHYESEYGYWDGAVWHPKNGLGKKEAEKKSGSSDSEVSKVTYLANLKNYNKKNGEKDSNWHCDFCHNFSRSMIYRGDKKFCDTCATLVRNMEKAKEAEKRAADRKADLCEQCNEVLTHDELRYGYCNKCMRQWNMG